MPTFEFHVISVIRCLRLCQATSVAPSTDLISESEQHTRKDSLIGRPAPGPMFQFEKRLKIDPAGTQCYFDSTFAWSAVVNEEPAFPVHRQVHM